MGDFGRSSKDKSIHQKSRARGKKYKDRCGDLVGNILGKSADELKWDSNLRHEKRAEYVQTAIKLMQNPQFVLRYLRKLMQGLNLGNEVENALQVIEKALDKSKDAGPSEVHPPNSMEISLEIIPVQNPKGKIIAGVHDKEALVKVLGGSPPRLEMEFGPTFFSDHIDYVPQLNPAYPVMECPEKQQGMFQAGPEVTWNYPAASIPSNPKMEILQSQQAMKGLRKETGDHMKGIGEFQIFILKYAFPNGPYSVSHKTTIFFGQAGAGQSSKGGIRKIASAGECLQSMKGLRHQGYLKIDSLINCEQFINCNDGLALGKGLESLPLSEIGLANEFDGKGFEREGGFGLTVGPEFDNLMEKIMKDHETCIVEGYKVLNCNGDLVRVILQNHPNIAKSYRSAHPNFQSYFMNSIAEVYRKLQNKQEMDELDDLEKKMVQHIDLEYQQLIPWVKEMVAACSRGLERKRLQDDVDRSIRRLQEFDNAAESSKSKKPRLGMHPVPMMIGVLAGYGAYGYAVWQIAEMLGKRRLQGIEDELRDWLANKDRPCHQCICKGFGCKGTPGRPDHPSR
ncbi:hypothetical protein COLO4_37129 [Corchorus olitorius]|uniref:Uncharacterized protein n=1 Tax=Corchorus olitorius TaxID=93759 RepID=A0A1R3G386_9ROSI|nr:hypothetical protein COLO4_37129 [Corchorus olitorius]